ncbi:MAG TPA: SEC-C metal-binding domain-containing protein [Polyangiaceae bacterium]|nr:SEC-C metal-binding domain-containing protein [Polyangiaceae bacterium]
MPDPDVAFRLPKSLLDLLASTAEELRPELHAEVLARAPGVVPELIAIIDNEELALEDAPGEGWLPVHAVDLLVDLEASDAVSALLSALMRGDLDDILSNRIAVRLPELGRNVFEPAVHLMQTIVEEEKRDTLCSIIAQLGVRDERVFGWCKERFERDQVLGAISFADYGDERALPLLRAAIEEFEPEWRSPFGLLGLTDLVEAYERIAQELPSDLAQRANSLRQAFEDDNPARSELAPIQPQAISNKVGRNEPCPCGSGKKFKKCCGAA